MTGSVVLTILAVVLVIGGLGAVFGGALSAASKKFAVQVDEREEEIIKVLPGANCGGCGFQGCAAYAHAVTDGAAEVNRCTVGGADVAQDVAEIMGIAAGEVKRIVGYVRCIGSATGGRKYDYIGLDDCFSALNSIGGGPLECRFGCIGLGSCARTCPYGAVTVESGAARVDRDLCKGCTKCVSACPKRLITMVDYGSKPLVGCSSRSKGAVVRKLCELGCLGDGSCARACPNQAITVVDNLAVIDYTKCTGCGKCAEKCIRHCIELV
ncbi:MAG: RnfABCDGE type electron transport complex subunit B [Oscillospiraceae bacterium]|jgi:Na+-translocating ferredoxin:NAD+ oxidoreductase RNF subunit RnfB|nr:RnfABCDGE type electron transport complex subunit B [Oscillospiraceae bacterium]